MFRRIRGDAGFTLVELLVTVTIIGVLAAVVTVGVAGASSNAQTKSNQANFVDVQSGIDAWLASNPTNSLSDILVGGTDASTLPAQWYTGTGTVGASAPLNTNPANFYGTITFTQTTGLTQPFNGFFRLNSSTVTCVLPKASAGATAPSSSVVFSCHN